MSRETADLLWGADVVAAALAEPCPRTLDAAERAAVARRARELGAGGLRAWALALSWAEFCAVVSLISGRDAENLLTGDSDAST